MIVHDKLCMFTCLCCVWFVCLLLTWHMHLYINGTSPECMSTNSGCLQLLIMNNNDRISWPISPEKNLSAYQRSEWPGGVCPGRISYIECWKERNGSPLKYEMCFPDPEDMKVKIVLRAASKGVNTVFIGYDSAHARPFLKLKELLAAEKHVSCNIQYIYTSCVDLYN